MSATLIDSHAHLDFEQFDSDREQVLQRARDSGVERIITVGTDLESSVAALQLAQRFDALVAAAGVHPHSAGAFDDGDWPQLAALWAAREVCAVGETGLDYHYDHSPRPRQRELFARHLEASGDVGLPLIIHVREAYDDAFAAIADSGLPSGGVLHCFTGGVAEAEKALELGLYVSFSGIATFPKAETIREAAQRVPADRLLVETDAPYLAPVPKRGKRNEPSFVVHTAQRVAEARGESYDALCAQTRENTRRLFGLDETFDP
jgi:TatD DNase family protein